MVLHEVHTLTIYRWFCIKYIPLHYRDGFTLSTDPCTIEMVLHEVPTLTCSFDVTAQKTLSVKPCEGNIRKQIPPMTRLSLISARHLCFLEDRNILHVM